MHCALILGDSFKIYSIIPELCEKNVKEIILLNDARRPASFSNKIKN